MNIPAPESLGLARTIALEAPLGWLSPAILELAGSRAPVFVQRLGSARERASVGPRELRDQTFSALEQLALARPWGFGGACREGEEAALFAIAGATWFSFDLTAKIDPLADSMSLDTLDTAIVALEDDGCFSLGWHEAYLDPARAFHGAPGFAFPEERLARAAAKYGRALDFAEQLYEAARVAGGGGLPDVEFRFDAAGSAATAAECIFLCAEIQRRGLLSGAGTRLRPAYGPWYEPGGNDDDFAPPEELRNFPALCPRGITLSAPVRLARAMGWEGVHLDASDECRLAFCTRLAQSAPPLFRRWVKAAHLAFPYARAGKQITTGEDDVRSLPDVEDGALVSTYLETRQGRQLLLAAWDEASAELGDEVRQALAGK